MMTTLSRPRSSPWSVWRYWLRSCEKPEESAAEALRLAAELARTIDALIIEDVDPTRLADAAADAPELAAHWEKALERFSAVLDRWPSILAGRGRIDLTDRRNRLLRRTADRWSGPPAAGFTVAAGLRPQHRLSLPYSSHRADAAGMVVLPGLSLAGSLPDEEWEALGPDERRPCGGHSSAISPQGLLDRIGVARGEVQLWPSAGGGLAGCQDPRDRARDDCRRLQRQMECAKARRAAADRDSSGRAA
jgi:ATP-dependent helicase/nuclease subunit B